jgi:glutathione synthase/RimK-type ligase-like ATP-grasp enzyme
VDEFIAVLQRIDESAATLINELSLLQWNMRKSYLRDLQSRGADIVPTLWVSGFNAADVANWFVRHQSDSLIIKPEVGANAQDTFLLKNPVENDAVALLSAAFSDRNFLVQPFIDTVCGEGEYSLFYFAGEFSHAIVKKPTSGDFRSQEEHGASIDPVQPEPDLLAAADTMVALLRPQPAYVRIDLVRGLDDRFLLMELELIEPSLYFRTDDAAPARFAAAFDQYFRELSA